MARPATALRIVADPDTPQPRAPGAASGSDLSLLAFLLAVGLFPIAGWLAGGRWGQGTLGAATAIALLAGRALVVEVRRRARSRR